MVYEVTVQLRVSSVVSVSRMFVKSPSKHTWKGHKEDPDSKKQLVDLTKCCHYELWTLGEVESGIATT